MRFYSYIVVQIFEIKVNDGQLLFKSLWIYRFCGVSIKIDTLHIPVQRVWGSSKTPLQLRATLILYYKLISIKVVQSLSVLSSNCPYIDESRNIHCVHNMWKRVGQPRLLEGGVRLTPYTVRQSGFILWPLTGSKRFKQVI